MRTFRLLLLLALGSCSHNRGVKAPQIDATSVDAKILSATLADDCGAPRAEARAARAAKIDADSSDSIESESQGYRRYCKQTQVVLEVTGGPSGPGAEIALARVELLDEDDRVIGVLTARNPQSWLVDDGTYASWNQHVAPSETLSVSYDLSAPDFGPVGGVWEAQSKSFRLRATLSVTSGGQTEGRVVLGSARLWIEPEIET